MAELQFPVKCNHGKAIRINRLAKGYPKQQALADAMKMAQSTLSDYERSAVLKDDVIKRFADFFEIDENLIRYFPDEEGNCSLVIESNTYEAGSSPVTVNSNSGSIINNPVEAILQLCKEKEDLLLSQLEIERKKSEQLTKLLTEIEDLRKEIKKK